MAKKIIRTGTTADPTGDSLKNAFTKVNDNFTELYNALGLDAETLNLGAFEFTGSVMSTTDSSSIVIDQATTVTSNLSVGGDLLPQTANGGDLGSSSLPWRSLYVSNNTIYIGNTAISVNQSGKLTVGGSSISDSIGKIALGTSKLELTDEAASRLSLYNSNTEKSRIQINGNDLLLSSLSGGVVLAATDGVGGEWRFKTNGNLESTGGNFLSTAETPAVFGSLNSTSTGASSGTVTLKSGIGAVDGGSIYIEAGTGGSGNDGEVAIRTGSGPYEWLFDNGGNLTLPRGSLKHDDALGFFTVEGPVTADMIDAGSPGTYHTISNGVQILTHRPSDDLERKFRFSWDGALYMPTDSSNGQVGAVEWRGGNTTSQVRSTPGGGIFPPGLALVSYSTDGSNAGISFNIDFNKNWIFDKYGNTRIPGDIISEGNINIDINLTDSTLRRWTFGEDGVLNLAGNLQFADGTVQTTALRTSQDESSVAIGGSGSERAGDGISAQGAQAIAIGLRAARSGQGNQAVAIGSQTGEYSQGIGAVAIGTFAGATSQTTNAIAIGTYAGQTNQGSGAIAIGRMAGFTGQAIRSIAIGDSAGKTDQHEGTIVLNSTGSPLDTEGTGRFYVKSIRNVTGGSVPSGFFPAYYNPTTGEFIVVSP